MTASPRIQFRINKAREAKLIALAKGKNITPNTLAKYLFETALDLSDFDTEAMSKDLAVVRAGIEQMYRRSGNVDELEEAVERLADRREATRSSDATSVDMEPAQ